MVVNEIHGNVLMHMLSVTNNTHTHTHTHTQAELYIDGTMQVIKPKGRGMATLHCPALISEACPSITQSARVLLE